MMFSPALAPLHVSAFPPRRGGTLARHYSSLPGHLLFRQSAHQCVTDFTDTNEAAVFSPAARRTGAAINRHDGAAPPRRANSRPFSLPFVHVDHFTHLTVSNVSPVRTCETKESDYAEKHKRIWHSRG